MMSAEGEQQVQASMEAMEEPYAHAIKGHDLCGPRRRILYLGIGLVVLILVIVLPITLSGRNKESEETPQYVQVQAGAEEELYDMIDDALKSQGVPSENLLLTTTYQYKAFKWLSLNRHLKSYSRTQTLQRYALAALYYSTWKVPTEYTKEPKDWINDHMWMTNEPECTWAGVQCDAALKIEGISLEKNKMSGKLPPDLAMIRETLHTLDLTSNEIHMKEDEMDETFKHLSHLHTLNIDDNYFTTETGFPESFKKLTKLKEIKASYNLMAGPLDNGVLDNLQQLTHLEAESNFFTGALHFLGDMPNMVYIYLRRNDLNAHLHFMNVNMTNLFSLWLDGNAISESIPTKIYHLSSLASFSVANASLTGTLPTEMGSLPKLNRVWLYGNKLEGTVPTEIGNLTGLEVFEVHRNFLAGTMPQKVCKLIKDSTYDQKSLAADCALVSCDDCCTKCPTGASGSGTN